MKGKHADKITHGARISQIIGISNKNAPAAPKKYFLGKSDAKSTPVNPTVVKIATPKEGWIKIKKNGIKKKINALINLFI